MVSGNNGDSLSYVILNLAKSLRNPFPAPHGSIEIVLILVSFRYPELWRTSLSHSDVTLLVRLGIVIIKSHYFL